MSVGFPALEGQRVSNVVADAHIWTIRFSEGTTLTIECPWRIVANGGIAFGRNDHNQKFGLPEPVNGMALVESLLCSSDISTACADDETGDLTIVCSDGVRLELFNDSSGYEGWQMNCSDGSVVIGMGGGSITKFESGIKMPR